jgi:soluble lytic murein transglycosylase-like protein
MDRMILFLCGGLVALSVIGTAFLKPETAFASDAQIDRWQQHIAEASRRFRIPEAWIRAVIKAESGGQTMRNGRPITSSAGALGLMQVMPDTWSELRNQLGLDSDPHDPRANILAGTAYLRAMYDRFGYPGLFAAYNAGPARYQEHLRTGKPLPAETRAYMKKLAKLRADVSMPPAESSGTRLFFPLRAKQNPGADNKKAEPVDEIFVPLRTGSASQ